MLSFACFQVQMIFLLQSGLQTANYQEMQTCSADSLIHPSSTSRTVCFLSQNETNKQGKFSGIFSPISSERAIKPLQHTTNLQFGTHPNGGFLLDRKVVICCVAPSPPFSHRSQFDRSGSGVSKLDFPPTYPPEALKFR